MAKIKKRKLKWTASESPQVVGYKLYWAQGEGVDYDCPSTKLGSVTEVVLPDDVEGFQPESGPIEFGVAAVDEMGNESDMTIISAPHQFNVPQAPEKLWIENHKESPEASLPQTESHISLLEHTIKDAERSKDEDSPDQLDDPGKVSEPVNTFGSQ